MRDLAVLPKAHLHLHLDGEVREHTLRAMCESRGVEAPVLPLGKTYESFAVFMDAITACHDVLSVPDNLVRVMGEVIEDAAHDGAVWVEVSLWPGLFQGRLGSERDALELVLDAGHAAAARVDIGFGLMVAANRHAGPVAAQATARLAVDLASQGVVSFGLDGDEAAFPPAPFAPAFDLAANGGLLCTPHAGELLGPDSVADALDLLHADRILHGVRSVEDPTLLARLATAEVCLDVCPTSNLARGLHAADPSAAAPARGGRPVQRERRRPLALREQPPTGVRTVSHRLLAVGLRADGGGNHLDRVLGGPRGAQGDRSGRGGSLVGDVVTRRQRGSRHMAHTTGPRCTWISSVTSNPWRA